MGPSLSPIVAKLYMETFETFVLEEYGRIKPKLWLRFEDNTIVILENRNREDFFRFISNKDSVVEHITKASSRAFFHLYNIRTIKINFPEKTSKPCSMLLCLTELINVTVYCMVCLTATYISYSEYKMQPRA